MQYPKRGITLTRVDRIHILDAIEDALAELQEEELNDLVTGALIDKLISAGEILQREEV